MKYRQYQLENAHEKISTKSGEIIFPIFCLWSFVLIGRPQDFLSILVPLRPALTIGLLILIIFISRYSYLLKKIDLHNPQIRKYLYLVIMMVLSIPFAYHRKIAFMFVFTKYLVNILYFFFFFVLVDSIQKVKSILFLCCIGTMLYSLFSLISGGLTGGRLFAGNMFDPNDLAFFLISFLPLNFLFISNSETIKKKIVGVVNICCSLIVTLMTGSRGGFIALGVIILLLFFKKTKTIRAAYKMIFLCLVSVLIFMNKGTIDFDRFATLMHPSEDYNLTDEFGRKQIWEQGLKLMIMNPVTGVGVGCFDMALGYYRESQGKIAKWQTAHNSWIQMGTETGIIGFILFALLSIGAFRTFKKASKSKSIELKTVNEMLIIGFIGHFICAMFISQAYSIYWTFYIAISATSYKFLMDFEKKAKAS